MILTDQCEELGRWFEETYPMYGLTIHQGRGKKNCEEYVIELEYEGKHKAVKLQIPDHAEFQDKEYIRMLRKTFLEQNKREITRLIEEALRSVH